MTRYTLTDNCEKTAVTVHLLSGETTEDAEMRAAAKLLRKNGHTYACQGGWWYRQRTLKGGYFEAERAACFSRNPLEGDWT